MPTISFTSLSTALFACILAAACKSTPEADAQGGGGGTAQGGGGGTAQGGGGGTAQGGGGGTTGDCSASKLDACEYPSRDVSHTEQMGISVIEPVSGRELPLLARVPEGEGPFPTIVWSHGGGFNDNGHRQAKDWGDALASHGFVVIHIAHASVTTESGTAVCGAASVPTNECVPGDEDANGLVAVVKTHDVVAVLDALPMLSDASVAAGGPAIDLDHVAVAGWSAGSRGPLVTHGAVILPSASAPPFEMSHSRPKAAMALSPMGPGYGGLFDEGSDNSWKDTRGPILTITGDNDIKASKPDVSGEDRRVAFEKQPADGSRWLLYSNLPPGVGGHATFNLEMLGDSDERVDRFSRAMRSVALAFFDAQLRDDPDAEAYLASDDPATLAGDADWVHK